MHQQDVAEAASIRSFPGSWNSQGGRRSRRADRRGPGAGEDSVKMAIKWCMDVHGIVLNFNQMAMERERE